jgi:ABC-2 type transport system ATP-binding protein
MIAISLQNLCKTFGKTKAVDAISLEIEKGSMSAILGSNGAGKTTTLSMIMGVITPSAGRIEILGKDFQESPYDCLSQMNFSSPYVELPKSLTVWQNLKVFAGLYNVPNLKDRVDELLEDFRLTSLIKRKTGSLSAGQKTRLQLAKALLNKPEILLLDEPTASLDPESADWIREYLKKYQYETHATVLMASHNMFEVERLCDHIYLMHKGKIVSQGTEKDLKDDYEVSSLEEVFIKFVRSSELRT